MNREVLFITTLHGNESIPSSALASQDIPHIIANPEALSRKVRFIDMDMNKSFETGGKTLEELHAKQLLKEIRGISPSYVIDFHTTSAETEPFAIIVDPKMLEVAKTLGVKYVVYMKHNIKSGHSLIDQYPGVSVEAGTHGTEQAFKNTLVIAQSALVKQKNVVRLFEVYGTITAPGDYINFKPHKDGFVPVLAGEVSYDFFGLKAIEVKSFD